MSVGSGRALDSVQNSWDLIIRLKGKKRQKQQKKRISFKAVSFERNN